MIDNPSEILLALGRIDLLDQRVRTLEGSKAWVIGAATVVGATTSFLVKLL